MPVTTTFKDYYGILAINKTATEEDIKAAYKALVSIPHLITNMFSNNTR